MVRLHSPQQVQCDIKPELSLDCRQSNKRDKTLLAPGPCVGAMTIEVTAGPELTSNETMIIC